MTVFLAAGVLLCLGVALWWWRIRLRPAQLETVVANNNAKNVFVLVHGTFASAAKWTTKDSSLVKAISPPNPNTAVYSFLWWGRNSVRQRLYCAKELAKRLGWSAIFGVWARAISVESSPLGSWTVELFQPLHYEHGLLHSKSYETPGCLARIGAWCECFMPKTAVTMEVEAGGDS